jgi:hypothetical protein
METMESHEKFIYVFLIALAIFIAGVQIGIHQGRELQRQEYYGYITTD